MQRIPYWGRMGPRWSIFDVPALPAAQSPLHPEPINIKVGRFKRLFNGAGSTSATSQGRQVKLTKRGIVRLSNVYLHIYSSQISTCNGKVYRCPRNNHSLGALFRRINIHFVDRVSILFAIVWGQYQQWIGPYRTQLMRTQVFPYLLRVERVDHVCDTSIDHHQKTFYETSRPTPDNVLVRKGILKRCKVARFANKQNEQLACALKFAHSSAWIKVTTRPGD